MKYNDKEFIPFGVALLVLTLLTTFLSIFVKIINDINV